MTATTTAFSLFAKVFKVSRTSISSATLHSNGNKYMSQKTNDKPISSSSSMAVMAANKRKRDDTGKKKKREKKRERTARQTERRLSRISISRKRCAQIMI